MRFEAPTRPIRIHREICRNDKEAVVNAVITVLDQLTDHTDLSLDLLT